MQHLEADVVVIGGGTSGMAAAVAAAEGGASVIVLEKAATTGGTGNMGMGLFAVESRLQKEKNIALTRNEVFKIFMDYTHWRSDARLAKAYIDRSADTVDWLEKMGVRFLDVIATDPDAQVTCHIISGADGRSAPKASGTMIKRLTVKAQELGAKILLRTAASQVLKEGGQVVGVIAEDSSGEEFRADAKAIIIGTGGFGDSPEWIKKYTGYEWGRDMLSFRIPGLVGEGIRMAWEAGAGASEMIMHMIYILGERGESSLQQEQAPLELDIGVASRQPNLMVNLSGERFFNEEIMENNTFTGNAIAAQKERCAFNIFDGATKKDYEEKAVDVYYAVIGREKLENLGTAIERSIDRGSKNVFMADSLEELAAQTGIKPEGLRQNVEEYNRACEAGVDELFGKTPEYLRPVKQPKFYAIKMYPGAYGTLGGIKINYKTEVLTKDHEVIPGLYAVGVDANALYGDSYGFILPGNTMGFAINSGRMAGENAAEYIKSAAK